MYTLINESKDEVVEIHSNMELPETMALYLEAIHRRGIKPRLFKQGDAEFNVKPLNMDAVHDTMSRIAQASKNKGKRGRPKKKD